MHVFLTLLRGAGKDAAFKNSLLSSSIPREKCQDLNKATDNGTEGGTGTRAIKGVVINGEAEKTNLDS